MLRTLVNLNPIAELQQMADMMERALGESRGSLSNTATPEAWTLPVDIYERDNKLFIRAAVPGIKPDQLDISIDQNVLTIKGEITETTEQNDVVYRREYRYGNFVRSLRLPENIDTNNVSAEFDNGFVTISVPKVVPVKPEPLKIQVRNATQKPAQKSLQQENANEANGTGKKKVETKQPAHLS